MTGSTTGDSFSHTSSVDDLIQTQLITRRILNEVQHQRLQNFQRYGTLSLPDGVSAWGQLDAQGEMRKIRALFDAGEGTWSDALLRHVLRIHTTQTLQELRTVLIKVAARVVEWITDIDRRLGETRRLSRDNVPNVPDQ